MRPKPLITNAGGHFYGSLPCSMPSRAVSDATSGRAGCQPGPQISAVPAVLIYTRSGLCLIQFRNLHVG